MQRGYHTLSLVPRYIESWVFILARVANAGALSSLVTLVCVFYIRQGVEPVPTLTAILAFVSLSSSSTLPRSHPFLPLPPGQQPDNKQRLPACPPARPFLS